MNLRHMALLGALIFSPMFSSNSDEQQSWGSWAKSFFVSDASIPEVEIRESLFANPLTHYLLAVRARYCKNWHWSREISSRPVYKGDSHGNENDRNYSYEWSFNPQTNQLMTGVVARGKDAIATLDQDLEKLASQGIQITRPEEVWGKRPGSVRDQNGIRVDEAYVSGIEYKLYEGSVQSTGHCLTEDPYGISPKKTCIFNTMFNSLKEFERLSELAKENN